MNSKALGVVAAIAALAAAIALFDAFSQGAGPSDDRDAVSVYASLDVEFSRPILDRFESTSGIEVKKKFDAESTKTVGLTQALLAEKDRPLCDVFWNNEPVNTIRLKQAGLLAPFRPEAAKDFPKEFLDPDGMWVGFAARARVLLVNTDLVPADQIPATTADLYRLGQGAYKGKIAMAAPAAGSTRTWLAALYVADGKPGEGQEPTTRLGMLTDLARAGALKIGGGNKQTAQYTAEGIVAMGFTDTDDAMVEVEAGQPVKIVYLDGVPEAPGAMFFPNTLALIQGAPHPENGKKLIEYLLSPKVEIALAEGASAQIPVNPAIKPGTDFQPKVKLPGQVKVMPVDWDAVAEAWDEATAWIDATFQ